MQARPWAGAAAALRRRWQQQCCAACEGTRQLDDTAAANHTAGAVCSAVACARALGRLGPGACGAHPAAGAVQGAWQQPLT